MKFCSIFCYRKVIIWYLFFIEVFHMYWFTHIEQFLHPLHKFHFIIVDPKIHRLLWWNRVCTSAPRANPTIKTLTSSCKSMRWCVLWTTGSWYKLGGGLWLKVLVLKDTPLPLSPLFCLPHAPSHDILTLQRPRGNEPSDHRPKPLKLWTKMKCSFFFMLFLFGILS